jgi:hypothetical protein
MAAEQRFKFTLGFARTFFEPELKSWRGEQPLGMVFWRYGILPSVSLIVLYVFSLYLGRIALQQALLLCFGGYTFWLLVSLWRCSKAAMDSIWGPLARQLVVVWAINTVLILAFLQIDLVGRYFDSLCSIRDLSVPKITSVGFAVE